MIQVNDLVRCVNASRIKWCYEAPLTEGKVYRVLMVSDLDIKVENDRGDQLCYMRERFVKVNSFEPNQIVQLINVGGSQLLLNGVYRVDTCKDGVVRLHGYLENTYYAENFVAYSGWVPICSGVKPLLSEADDGMVWITDRAGRVVRRTYDATAINGGYASLLANCNAVAWMPITKPEPYVEPRRDAKWETDQGKECSFSNDGKFWSVSKLKGVKYQVGEATIWIDESLRSWRHCKV